MMRLLQLLTLLLGMASAGCLMLSSQERSRFFLTRFVIKLLSPGMERDQQHRRFSLLCGTVLASVCIAAVLYFALAHLNRR